MKATAGDSIARRRGKAFAASSLRFDALEPRLAPAGIALVDGELVIDGTDNSDLITVVYEDPDDEFGNVVITIRKPSLVVVDEEVVDRDDIDSLLVNALRGSDRVINSTDIPDTIEGGEGNDFLQGGRGESRLVGGDHDDTLVGGLGIDYLFGEDGRDQLFADGYVAFKGQLLPKSLEHAVCDTLDDILGAILEADGLDGGSGDDALYGGGGIDLLLGGPGNDTLSGAECTDLLFGQSGADLLQGGLGHDYLHGGLGEDDLRGGAGDDILYGGDSNATDELRGGAGSDRFVFGGQPAELWWEQEARDFSDDDEWIYPWLLTDEELEIYLQPDLA
jgi:Ca2+-binding RTX toxin-like protein